MTTKKNMLTVAKATCILTIVKAKFRSTLSYKCIISKVKIS